MVVEAEGGSCAKVTLVQKGKTRNRHDPGNQDEFLRN